jgi:hypothetical protein
VTENEVLIHRAMAIGTLVRFENYTFLIREAHGGVVLYGLYDEADSYTGKVERQQTRKWILAPGMTDSEIVQTMFKLAATSMEHRLREHFQYKGKRIFGPHFDVEDLVALCHDRENAGGRQA